MKTKDKQQGLVEYPIKSVQHGKIIKPGRKTGASFGAIGQISRNLPSHGVGLASSPNPSVTALVPTLTKYFQVAGNVFLVACVLFDAYRVTSAVRKDVRRRGKLGKLSAKTTASIGSSWVVSTAGVYGGGVTGAWIGGSIGAAFAGIGAVPGAALGSFLGGLIGGVIGTLVGKTAGEAAVDVLAGDSDESDDEDGKENLLDTKQK